MIYRLILRLDTHKETDITKVLDKIQETLINLKHIDGEINDFEIRDDYHGGRRLRSG